MLSLVSMIVMLVFGLLTLLTWFHVVDMFSQNFRLCKEKKNGVFVGSLFSSLLMIGIAGSCSYFLIGFIQTLSSVK